VNIWLLPIEPLVERYSEQWLRWFPEELQRLGCNVVVLGGYTFSDKIERGQFLDVYGTHHYKATQLSLFAQQLNAGAVKDGDWVLLLDGWNPAVEQLAYMRDLGGVKFKIASCWHAGSYDPWDQLAQHPTMSDWAAYAERAHIAAVDRVFVATSFHAQLLGRARGGERKIVVTGFPLHTEEWADHSMPWTERSRRVVWPHRIAPEKAPESFEHIRQLYVSTYGDDGTEWVRSKDACPTKASYYALLGSARVAVSTAYQETWGIAMLEAASLGCHVVVPDRLSYQDLYDQHDRYTDRASAVEKIHAGLDALEKGKRWTNPLAISNMVACMRSCP